MVGWSISPLSLNPGVSVSPFISRPWDLCFSVYLSTLRSRNNEYTELIHAHSASEKHFLETHSAVATIVFLTQDYKTKSDISFINVI